VTRPGQTLLDKARLQAGLSVADLWYAYFALGGMARPEEVAEFVAGAREPARLDYDLLAQAINERLSELGGEKPTPYSDELGR